MIANLHPESAQPSLAEKRAEPRLRFCWDTQIFCDANPRGRNARMVDLNSRCAAILLENEHPVHAGSHLELGLMYPHVRDGEFEIEHTHRYGTVYRCEHYNETLKRVVVQFDEPLPDLPAVENDYVLH